MGGLLKAGYLRPNEANAGIEIAREYEWLCDWNRSKGYMPNECSSVASVNHIVADYTKSLATKDKKDAWNSAVAAIAEHTKAPTEQILMADQLRDILFDDKLTASIKGVIVSKNFRPGTGLRA